MGDDPHTRASRLRLGARGADAGLLVGVAGGLEDVFEQRGIDLPPGRRPHHLAAAELVEEVTGDDGAVGLAAGAAPATASRARLKINRLMRCSLVSMGPWRCRTEPNARQRQRPDPSD